MPMQTIEMQRLELAALEDYVPAPIYYMRADTLPSSCPCSFWSHVRFVKMFFVYDSAASSSAMYYIRKPKLVL